MTSFIQCDAGFDEITSEQALAYFSKDQITSWFHKHCGHYDGDISEEQEEAALCFELGLPSLANAAPEQVEAWYAELEGYDYFPRKTPVEIVTAKAVYGNHIWICPVNLAFPCSHSFARYERCAIDLGIMLRDHLLQNGSDSLLVVNDNKDAAKEAKTCHGSGVKWMRRNNVTQAHNAKLHKVTRIVTMPELTNFLIASNYLQGEHFHD